MESGQRKRDPAQLERELRRLVRRDRLRVWLQVAAVVVPVVALLLLFAFDPWSSPVEMSGVVVGLHQQPSQGEIRPTRFLVRLEDGRTVEVREMGGLRYQKGLPVRVAERTSRILRRTRHSLVRIEAKQSR